MIYKYISNVTSIKRDNYYLELISGSRAKGALSRKKAHCIDMLDSSLRYLSKSVTLLNDTFKFEHEFGYVAA